MPAAFSIMNSLEQYCNITTLTSEQHVDLTSSRIDRNDADLKSFLYWLDQRNPFIPRDHLISLSTGVIGGFDINCHNAFEKGEEGIKSMLGKTVDEVSLSKLYKVATLVAAKKGMINHTNFTAVDSSV
ncbi:unnamed protein product [Arctia plantaginis]|uniref:Uncharacterized protein n=1 Tax=Arctia plantaginis TaxID=874455 RepID=A0A8S1AU51_ARCPL|nr:unnamed protein product [Arctia plantaginis]